MKLRHFVVSAILAAAAYFAILGGEHSLYELWRIERQHKAELDRLDVLRDSLARLTARVDSLQTDDATVERIARERYGLVRPGERLYLFVEPPDNDGPPATADSMGIASREEPGGRPLQ